MNNKDVLVVIDAGHGGIDRGAVGNGLEEKNLTLRAAKYIYERLQELNIPVVITRTEDEYLPKEKRIERIRNLTNNNPNTLLISNHINAGGAEGAEIVYSLKNNSVFSDIILNNIGKKGQLKRKTYQRRLPENPNLDYYYILRETNSNEPVLIEYGFIDNKKDSDKLKNNIEEYAEAVVESISDYLGYSYEQQEQESEYIVQKGDTLYSIGRRFNISIDELKRINNLISNTLTIGQVLKLKEVGQLDNPIYIVQKGDTLYSIAKNNNISVDELVKINNLANSNLSIGQELYIPKLEEKIENNNLSEEYDFYTIKKGDSLWKIAREFDIPLPELIEINNLTNLTLSIGQTLLVPKLDNNTNNIYIVEKGDSLWSIAKNNNLSVDELKRLNNLDSNLLSIGQQLIITK